MLVTESLSALIILSLTAAVVRQGWGAPDLAAINPLNDTAAQVRSGLMVAVLSFIGFESAANLGSEALQPERAVPRSIRTAVLIAGGLFVVWGAFLPEGLAWLPVAARQGLDPLSALADRMGIPGAGLWIKVGALLCLFGTCIGVLTALARLHPRFGTPSCALLAAGLPLVAGGALVVQRNLTINQSFGLFGGFTVLGFLLVYGLVARQLLVGGTALAAVSAMAVAYLSGTVGQQNGMLITFAGLLLIGVLRVWWVLPVAADRLR